MVTVEGRVGELFAEVASRPETRAEQLVIKIVDQLRIVLNQDHINQKQLAEKMGVSPSHVSRLLNTSPNMTATTLVRLADALGTEPDMTLDKHRFPCCVHFQGKPKDYEDYVLDWERANRGTAADMSFFSVTSGTPDIRSTGTLDASS